MKTSLEDPVDDFDVEAAVNTYRHVIGLQQAESTAEGKAELQTTIKRLRKAWKDWQGEDSLHEAAYGKPAGKRE